MRVIIETHDTLDENKVYTVNVYQDGKTVRSSEYGAKDYSDLTRIITRIFDTPTSEGDDG